jgi:hypothetical protein
MANDQGWQRRSDEWVKASHESRKRKEQARREALANRYRRPEITEQNMAYH